MSPQQVSPDCEGGWRLAGEGASLMSGSAPGSPLMSLTGSSSEEAGGENTVQADKVGQPTLWTVS